MTVEKWLVIEIAEDVVNEELSFPQTYQFNDKDTALRFAEKRALEEAANSGKKIHCFTKKLEISLMVSDFGRTDGRDF